LLVDLYVMTKGTPPKRGGEEGGEKKSDGDGLAKERGEKKKKVGAGSSLRRTGKKQKVKKEGRGKERTRFDNT